MEEGENGATGEQYIVNALNPQSSDQGIPIVASNLAIRREKTEEAIMNNHRKDAHLMHAVMNATFERQGADAWGSDTWHKKKKKEEENGGGNGSHPAKSVLGMRTLFPIQRAYWKQGG